LKKEIEVLEAKKSHLLVEVGGLSATRANAENLHKEVESLRKEVEDARGVKALAAERASKAAGTAESLRKAIDAEKESGLMLQQQVGLLTRCLEAAKELGLTMVKMYVDTLGQFGSSTFDLLEEPTTFSLFT
jgi:methylthioribose-1-phosphate isomerase